jgi:hypothetical protein
MAIPKISNGAERLISKITPARQRQKLFRRILEIKPQSISILGHMQDNKPWEKVVSGFDDILLGTLQKKKIGLHFSSWFWDVSINEDPDNVALRIGPKGGLQYYAVNPELGRGKALNLFRQWADRCRSNLIVIDRELTKAREIEKGMNSLAIKQVLINGSCPSPVFYRSEWLIKDPIPLLSRLDFGQKEKIKDFIGLGLVYQNIWKQDISGDPLRNFYILSFSVANGFRLIDALKKAI